MAVKKSIAIIGEGETEWWYFETLRVACRYKFKVAGRGLCEARDRLRGLPRGYGSSAQGASGNGDLSETEEEKQPECDLD